MPKWLKWLSEAIEWHPRQPIRGRAALDEEKESTIYTMETLVVQAVVLEVHTDAYAPLSLALKGY